MKHLKRVALLPIDAEPYTRFMGAQAAFAKANTGPRERDPRLDVTLRVEEGVRAVLREAFVETRFRVLHWEERDLQNRCRGHFKELDGVFDLVDGGRLIVEVKASMGRARVKSALQQIRSAVNVASLIHPTTTGLLVLARPARFGDLFAEPMGPALQALVEAQGCQLLPWPPGSGAIAAGLLYVSVVPETEVDSWFEGVVVPIVESGQPPVG